MRSWPLEYSTGELDPLGMSHRLTDLKRGESAAIVAVHGQSLYAKQLADMGFVRGAHLTMLRTGFPCIVRIQGGSKVALGEGYQADIEVTSVPKI